MKSKLIRILGIVAVVAMLATALVAPVAAVSGVNASITAGSAIINAIGNYTVTATLGAQLVGTNGIGVTFPYAGEKIRFTAAAATDKVAIAITGTNPNVSLGGTGTYVGGVVSFGAIADYVEFTTAAANTVLTYTKTVGNATVGAPTDLSGPPTCTAAPGAFTLPDVGDAVVFTAAAATDVVTLSVTTNLNVVFAPVGTATYAAGVITFSAVGQTATVTSTVAQVAGTWARTAGLATGGTGTDVANPVVVGAAAANGDTITLTYPTGFTISAPTGTIAATSGWVTIPPATVPTYLAANLTAATKFSFTGQTIKVTLGAGDYIGNGAQILINLTAGVANPATAGSYTLTFQTSQETTAVTSNTFTISNPVIAPLPGVASVYNTAGVLVGQGSDFAAALVTVAAYPGGTIKLSAGTYKNAFVGATVDCTIQGTDASAANVILKSTAPWTMTGTTVVIDKVTIDGTTGALIMNNTKVGTISNSNLMGAAVTFNGAGVNTVDTDAFTVLTGANGLVVNAPTTVKNSTFSVAGTGVGIAVAANVTVSGSTFTGVSGAGLALDLNGGTASVVGTSTFTGLSEALDVTAPAAVSFGGNTVDKCGIATTGPDTIMVNSTAGNGVLVYNNKITNSLGYIINVAANDNLVFVMGNNFSGNAKNAKDAANAVVGTALNVTHNYWGGTNPASVLTAPLISYDNPLGGAPTNGTIGVGTTLDASATAGVKITASTGSTVVGAFALAANPLSLALPSTVTAVKYYDVFGVGTTSATIRFLGTTANPITSANAVYYYDAVFGKWSQATTAAVNPFGNYVDVNAGAITGLPMALVSVIPTQAPPPADITPQYPATGATDVPVDATFTWQAVTGATGYQFAIAQDNPDLTNKFAVLDYSANTPTNAEKLQEVLLYNTTYWWEVRAVSGTVASPIYSPWSIISFFTTEKAPVTTSVTTTSAPPPVTIVQTSIVVTQPPATTITITNPPAEKTQPIPSYLLWAVIAVGAVLVIAVIVLIVRTRRMP